MPACVFERQNEIWRNHRWLSKKSKKLPNLVAADPQDIALGGGTGPGSTVGVAGGSGGGTGAQGHQGRQGAPGTPNANATEIYQTAASSNTNYACLFSDESVSSTSGTKAVQHDVDTFWFNPVNRLNTAVLPELGFPKIEYWKLFFN